MLANTANFQSSASKTKIQKRKHFFLKKGKILTGKNLGGWTLIHIFQNFLIVFSLCQNLLIN